MVAVVVVMDFVMSRSWQGILLRVEEYLGFVGAVGEYLGYLGCRGWDL